MHQLVIATKLAADIYKNKTDSDGAMYLTSALDRAGKALTIDDKVVALLLDVFNVSNINPEELTVYKGIHQRLIDRIKAENGFCAICGLKVGKGMINNTNKGPMCTSCFYANCGDMFYVRYQIKR